MVAFDVTENCLLVSNFLTLFIHILAEIFGVNADSPSMEELVSLEFLGLRTTQRSEPYRKLHETYSSQHPAWT